MTTSLFISKSYPNHRPLLFCPFMFTIVCLFFSCIPVGFPKLLFAPEFAPILLFDPFICD